MRGIVLSGGGAKGAYQIGVWKALLKLHISYDLVTGSSVGALNGAFFVQGDYKKAKKLWENMNFNLIFSEQFSETILQKGGTFERMKLYLKSILKSGGMNVSALEETINQMISVSKFYESKVDFGLTTVNLSTLKPVELTKKEIPKEKLGDYLMASATCFPAFQLKKIEKEVYIDGGYFDNLPISLAIKMGATEIIAVDLDGSRRKKWNVPITYISPKNELGSFLVFDDKAAKKAMCYGYNDTMKVYGKLEGNCFTFQKWSIRYDLKWYKKIKNRMFQLGFQKDSPKSNVFQKRMGKLKPQEFHLILLECLEYLGKVFQLDDTVIYLVSKFQQLLKKELPNVSNSKNTFLNGNFKNLKGYQKDFLSSLYGLLLSEQKGAKEQLKKMAILFPKECFAAFYLFTLS